jgi:hypothetical protein
LRRGQPRRDSTQTIQEHGIRDTLKKPAAGSQRLRITAGILSGRFEMIGDLLAVLGIAAAVLGATEACLALASLTFAWCVIVEADIGR